MSVWSDPGFWVKLAILHGWWIIPTLIFALFEVVDFVKRHINRNGDK